MASTAQRESDLDTGVVVSGVGGARGGLVREFESMGRF